ncbi:hypothetical protein GPALN_007855 [Globodera pallida]|nr:hypothetical protein GPALN_007855 [Globodera pallida]
MEEEEEETERTAWLKRMKDGGGKKELPSLEGTRKSIELPSSLTTLFPHSPLILRPPTFPSFSHCLPRPNWPQISLISLPAMSLMRLGLPKTKCHRRGKAPAQFYAKKKLIIVYAFVAAPFELPHDDNDDDEKRIFNGAAE